MTVSVAPESFWGDSASRREASPPWGLFPTRLTKLDLLLLNAGGTFLPILPAVLLLLVPGCAGLPLGFGAAEPTMAGPAPTGAALILGSLVGCDVRGEPGTLFVWAGRDTAAGRLFAERRDGFHGMREKERLVRYTPPYCLLPIRKAMTSACPRLKPTLAL